MRRGRTQVWPLLYFGGLQTESATSTNDWPVVVGNPRRHIQHLGMDACRSSEKIDAHSSQFRWRESELRSRVGMQTGFTSAIQEDRKFNEVLIRESVRTVVGD